MEFARFWDRGDGEAFGRCREHAVNEYMKDYLLCGVSPCRIETGENVEREAVISRCPWYLLNTWAQIRDGSSGGGRGGESPGPSKGVMRFRWSENVFELMMCLYDPLVGVLIKEVC